MDERAINGAAIEAIRDLELDCEIKGVLQPSGGETWCIQFSGNYGQFCDEFKNQFGKESSHRLIREKIKQHLIKQISKIRSSTGRKRKPAVVESDESRATESELLAAPLRLIGEVFDRLTGVTGIVVNQAATAAEAARDAVTEAASNLSPVTIEVRSKTRTAQKRASRAGAKRSAQAAQASPAKPRKASKKASPATRKQAQKASKKAAGKASGKTSGSGRKAAKKTSKAR